MEIPRHWRLKKQRYSLIGDIDKDGGVSFPPGQNRPRFYPSPENISSNICPIDITDLIKKEEVVYQNSDQKKLNDF